MTQTTSKKANPRFELFSKCYLLYQSITPHRIISFNLLPTQIKLNWYIRTKPLREKNGLTDLDYLGLHAYAYLFDPNAVGIKTLGELEQVHYAFRSYNQWCDQYAEEILANGLIETIYANAPSRVEAVIREETSGGLTEAFRAAFA